MHVWDKELINDDYIGSCNLMLTEIYHMLDSKQELKLHEKNRLTSKKDRGHIFVTFNWKQTFPPVTVKAAPVVQQSPVAVQQATPVVQQSPVAVQQATPIVQQSPVVVQQPQQSPVVVQQQCSPVVVQQVVQQVAPQYAQQAAPQYTQQVAPQYAQQVAPQVARPMGIHASSNVAQSMHNNQSPLQVNSNVILTSVASRRTLRVMRNGSVNGQGGTGMLARFTVKPGRNAREIRLQSKSTGRFLRIMPNHSVDGLGGMGPYTCFQVERLPNNTIGLISSQNLGRIGILPNGQVKHPKQTGRGPHGQLMVQRI